MGDRGNIIVDDGGHKVWLYTHWTGSELKEIIKRALSRGKYYWTDGPYLARVLFCEMVKDDINGISGFGISAYEGDGGIDYTINIDKQTVTFKEEVFSFDGFIKSKILLDEIKELMKLSDEELENFIVKQYNEIIKNK